MIWPHSSRRVPASSARVGTCGSLDGGGRATTEALACPLTVTARNVDATLERVFKVSLPQVRPVAGLYGRALDLWHRALARLPRLPRRQPAPVPAARQLRPVIIPDSLADLNGPKVGVVELPLTLFWSRPDRTFDLSDRHRAIDMYLAVLDAARTPEDLATYLNGKLLVQLWPDLHLTRAKRRPWEDQFEVLRRPAA